MQGPGWVVGGRWQGERNVVWGHGSPGTVKSEPSMCLVHFGKQTKSSKYQPSFGLSAGGTNAVRAWAPRQGAGGDARSSLDSTWGVWRGAHFSLLTEPQ